MNMKKIYAAAMLLASFGAQAQQSDDLVNKYAATITPEDLKAHLSILASDAYEGRETGEKGQKMAAEYIYKHFEKLGLEGPVKENAANKYFQPVKLMKSYWKALQITQGKNSLNLFEQLYPYGNFEMDKDLEVVFLGYGIDSEKYSDYKALGEESLMGKAVVIYFGEPRKADGTSWVTGEAGESKDANVLRKVQLAQKKGASLIIMVHEDEKSFSARNTLFKSYYSKPSLSLQKSGEEAGMNLIFTAPEYAAQLLGSNVAKMKKAMDKVLKKGGTLAGKMRKTIHVKAERASEEVMSENVLGFIEGTDKKDEILVLTAHYDHVGIIDGQIHNGADDDGSGTVAVLEMAQAFAQAKAEGNGPRRSILFMTVTGEEKGLLGSEYYSENPIFPLANTVVNLNTDMIGRVDKKHEANPNYIYIIGSDMLSSELHALHEEVGKRYAPDVELDYEYNSENDPNRYYYRSDHYNFAKNNIPVIFYFNGTHDDYHKPGDDVEKINFDKMAKITRLTFSTAWVIANREQRVVVDKAK